MADMRVVMAGDVTMDWNLARIRESSHGTKPTRATTANTSFEPGGAALLGRLMKAVAAGFPNEAKTIEVVLPALPSGTVTPDDERFHHSYALWSRPEDEEGPWRVNRFLGFDQAAPAALRSTGDWGGPDPEDADLVILDDAGLGFRGEPSLWPRALDSGTPTVLLKMASPVADGQLWDRLQQLADRLIVVIRIDDLRKTEVNISRELSWERSAQDLMWELLYNQRVNDLARCAHVVVSFSTAGAFLLSGGTGAVGTPECTLIFDPKVMEATWNEQHPGAMMGYTVCLTAGIARQLLASPTRPDIRKGIQRGIEAMRTLHVDGYRSDGSADHPHLGFPVEDIAGKLAKEDMPFSETPVRDPTASLPGAAESSKAVGRQDWTILRQKHRDGLEDLAWDIVREGTKKTLADVPQGEFGRLFTVDRHEIEGYRSIRVLIREYAEEERPERPLSIAVFGPPGSGKSFGVKEVARSVLPGRITDPPLTFNLSQFDDPSALIGAFHQVRDKVLAGLLPLVFWDEFDTMFQGKELGWLRYFLSPMQDGEFQEDQITHSIGPAVFVFAGGTSARMQKFGSKVPDFVDVKGPDFVSRLKGYVNVLGPDRQGDDDPYYLVRRAILLRMMLKRDHDHLFREEDGKQMLQIDPGVLRAFLLTTQYKHGARSMESILAMSSLWGKGRFERSCLPAEPQLDLHVDAENFLDLVQRLDLQDQELIDRMAETAHIVFSAALLEKGKTWGEESDDYLLAHALLKQYAGHLRDPEKAQDTLVSWDALSEENQEENRALVRDIPNKLAAAGFAMRPARSGEAPAGFSKEEVEVLAEREHDRWVRSKLKGGWSWGPGPDKDEEAHLHPDILPWSKTSLEDRIKTYGEDWAKRIGDKELPDGEKQKDRDLIEGIARILAASGYTVVKVGAQFPA